MTMKDKAIYILFFSSPYKISKLIRKVTKYKYNHAAISFDAKLSLVYSFSRYNKNNPFYGGFVHESLLRYNNNGKTAEIKICKIPISNELYIEINDYINSLKEDDKDYFYYLYSGIEFVFSKKININKSYTCIEFVLNIFTTYLKQFNLEKNKFYSIKDLVSLLDEYCIYEGRIDQMLIEASWNEDNFLDKKNLLLRTGYLLNNSLKLTYRLIRNTKYKGDKNE